MQPDFDLAVAQRWFAVQLNNQAWDLIEQPRRGAEDEVRLLHAAHASVHHWTAIGTALHRQRALCLLANAYLALGDGAGALRWATACAEGSEANGDEQTPFDRATAWASLASARRLAGRDGAAGEARARAEELLDALEDADERTVVEQVLARGPAPEAA